MTDEQDRHAPGEDEPFGSAPDGASEERLPLSEFRVTHDDLHAVLRDRAGKYVNNAFDAFLAATGDQWFQFHSHICVETFGDLNRIGAVLGEAAVEEAVGLAEFGLREGCKQPGWSISRAGDVVSIFLDGTEGAQKAYWTGSADGFNDGSDPSAGRRGQTEPGQISRGNRTERYAYALGYVNGTEMCVARESYVADEKQDEHRDAVSVPSDPSPVAHGPSQGLAGSTQSRLRRTLDVLEQLARHSHPGPRR